MRRKKAYALLLGCFLFSVLLLGAAGRLADAQEERIGIVLSQAGSTSTDDSVAVNGGTVTITRAGTYEISGSLTEGQLRVEAGSGESVELVLAGVSIANSTEAALHVERAGQVTIRLQSGTENRLQSGQETEITSETAVDEAASGGALYAREDVTITGDGTLTVMGYINNGIQTADNLVIEDGVLLVQAVNNGLKGKESVTITGGSITLLTGGDGIKSDSTNGAGEGTVTITGGSFAMTCYGDGIQAETTLTVSGGTFEMVCGGGSAGVTHALQEEWMRWDMDEESGTSTKGLKSGAEMALSGGMLTVDSRDDAIHANGSIVITGGSYALSTGDDGIHADDTLTIEGGEIRILTSYEGLEANQILIAGGDVSITSSDDGINANGGDASIGGWMGGRGGAFRGGTDTLQESGDDAGKMPNLRIAGGTILIDAGGDGLDSNGNICIEGGTVIVNGPENSGNGAIDYGTESGGTCTITGGTVLALGASGMAESFDSSSFQCSFLTAFSGSYAAGDEIVIANGQGDVLFAYTAQKRGSSVVFSSPELVLGETYTVSAGSQQVQVTLTGVSTESGASGGFGRGGRGH